MPLKRIDPSSIDLSQYKPAEDINYKYNADVSNKNIQKGKEFVAGIANAGLQGAVNLAHLPFDITQGIGKAAEYVTGTKQRNDLGFIPDAIASAGVKGKQAIKDISGVDNLEPENALSKAAQLTASAWPFLLLSGGPVTAGKIAKDFAGSLGSQVSDNPFISFLGHVAGQKGFTNFSKWIKDLGKHPEDIVKAKTKRGDYISSLYDKRSDLGSELKVSPESKEILTSSLVKIDNMKQSLGKSSGGITKAISDSITDNLNDALAVLKDPNATFQDLTQQKMKFNNLLKTSSGPERDFNKKIRKIFSDYLDNMAKSATSPLGKEWGKAYKAADELHSIEKWGTNLGKWLNKNKSSVSSIIPNPLAQATLGLIGGLGSAAFTGSPVGVAAALVPPAGKFIVNSGEKIARESMFLNSLLKNNEGRKLMAEIVVDSAKDNANSLAKSLYKFNKKAEKFDENSKTRKVISADDIDLKQYKPA